MFRLVLLIFAVFFTAKSIATDNDFGVLINRLKRSYQSYDCGPNEHPHPPFWPPPPPFWPPPPPPPFWRHNPGEWGPNQQSHQDISDNNDFKGYENNGKPPCDNCSGNGAISNSQSDTGDAISVAISRSGKPKK